LATGLVADVDAALAACGVGAQAAATADAAGSTGVDGSGSGASAKAPSPSPAAAAAESLSSFVARAQARVAGLATALDAAATAFASLVSFFGEDGGGAGGAGGGPTVEAFLGPLLSFVRGLERADAENRAEEARKAREARRMPIAVSLGSPRGSIVTAAVAAAAADPGSPRPAGGASEKRV